MLVEFLASSKADNLAMLRITVLLEGYVRPTELLHEDLSSQYLYIFVYLGKFRFVFSYNSCDTPNGTAVTLVELRVQCFHTSDI